MKKHKKLSIVFISTGIFFVIVALTLTTLFIITKRTYAGNSYITQEEISQMPDNSILAKIENYEESGCN